MEFNNVKQLIIENIEKLKNQIDVSEIIQEFNEYKQDNKSYLKAICILTKLTHDINEIYKNNQNNNLVLQNIQNNCIYNLSTNNYHFKDTFDTWNIIKSTIKNFFYNYTNFFDDEKQFKENMSELKLEFITSKIYIGTIMTDKITECELNKKDFTKFLNSMSHKLI